MFAELHFPTGTLALGHTSTAALFNNAATPAQNKTVILEWVVDDIDAEYGRLKTIVRQWEQEPTLMPWGNRSILLRDPDGNLVNRADQAPAIATVTRRTTVFKQVDTHWNHVDGLRAWLPHG